MNQFPQALCTVVTNHKNRLLKKEQNESEHSVTAFGTQSSEHKE